MKKKWIVILMTACMSVTLLAGCSGSNPSNDGASPENTTVTATTETANIAETDSPSESSTGEDTSSTEENTASSATDLADDAEEVATVDEEHAHWIPCSSDYDVNLADTFSGARLEYSQNTALLQAILNDVFEIPLAQMTNTGEIATYTCKATKRNEIDASYVTGWSVEMNSADGQMFSDAMITELRSYLESEKMSSIMTSKTSSADKQLYGTYTTSNGKVDVTVRIISKDGTMQMPINMGSGIEYVTVNGGEVSGCITIEGKVANSYYE